jgi:hypothetical protein
MDEKHTAKGRKQDAMPVFGLGTEQQERDRLFSLMYTIVFVEPSDRRGHP